MNAVFVVLMAAGKSKREQSGVWGKVTAPPAGHDSVLGETGQGLNYDELVFYRNDAIIPRYLLYYTLPNKQ